MTDNKKDFKKSLEKLLEEIVEELERQDSLSFNKCCGWDDDDDCFGCDKGCNSESCNEEDCCDKEQTEEKCSNCKKLKDIGKKCWWCGE